MTMEVTPRGETALLREARDKFRAAFGRAPAAAACAPGRVNLIGDHVDYCEGFVLPMALPFLTVVVGDYNTTSEIRVLSVLVSGQELEIKFPAPTAAEPLKPGSPAWANYVKGVIANFSGTVKGFEAVIVSDVPMGSGLSSSASLEVAVFTFLEALTGKRCDMIEKARLCQKAEHEFPGMPCGIMDQYIATFGKDGHALLIDCRSLESTHIPLVTDEAVILVVNSNVKHQLTGSEYPQRRAQCQEAADRLGLPSLRDARITDLNKLKGLDIAPNELVLKRMEHVIGEIYRTEEVATFLQLSDLDKVGELFYQSHESLSKLMEVSCPELDKLLDIVKGQDGVYGARMTGGGFGGCLVMLVGELFYQSHESLSKLMEVSCPELDKLLDIVKGQDGVYGARMTGGGFGGCLVMLVKKDSVDNIKQRIIELYEGSPTFFVCKPSEGGRELKL